MNKRPLSQDLRVEGSTVAAVTRALLTLEAVLEMDICGLIGYDGDRRLHIAAAPTAETVDMLRALGRADWVAMSQEAEMNMEAAP